MLRRIRPPAGSIFLSVQVGMASSRLISLLPQNTHALTIASTLLVTARQRSPCRAWPRETPPTPLWDNGGPGQRSGTPRAGESQRLLDRLLVPLAVLVASVAG